MKTIDNKVVAITGAGSGIGRALAITFAEHGAKLALNDYNAETLEETIQMLPTGNHFYKAFDVANKQQMHQFADDVEEHFGCVDIIINNAGVGLGLMQLDEVSYEEFEWVIGVNMWGVIYGSKAFLPKLRTRSEAAIVNVSSLFGIMGIAEQTAYCTSKFAVKGFTEALRMELLDTHINVITVHPGGIKTNIATNSKGWNSRTDRKAKIDKYEKKALIHTPERAAKIILNAILKKKSRVLIGEEAIVGDWIVRTNPENYIPILAKTLLKYL